MSNPKLHSMSPAPTAEEAAAVVAAVEALWPRPLAPSQTPDQVTAWRFGSRPWLRSPLTARQHISRPWY
ncbi:MAG: hypothetical protein O3B40_03470 [Actinobacteria bacterium]|nr:hypothetical protein [Ilumatobacteraceae bacterium]MDA0299476.1 hypothetical protein [Actinomycetota bacterium]MDA2994748.1 hypothetical protein [Actinomycetota bacterium]